ncbi:MAG: carboxypeptidase-like regulatory domain-containing protein [Thaumarchaeota archaeon]|nr:carboxypeptidase-like regulatory domain-containing protein [Nitrososphaerota archaeon]
MAYLTRRRDHSSLQRILSTGFVLSLFIFSTVFTFPSLASGIRSSIGLGAGPQSLGASSPASSTERRFGFGYLNIGAVRQFYDATTFFNAMFLTPPYPSTAQFQLGALGDGVTLEFQDPNNVNFLLSVMQQAQPYPNIKLDLIIFFDLGNSASWNAFSTFLDTLAASPGKNAIGLVGLDAEHINIVTDHPQPSPSQEDQYYAQAQTWINQRGFEAVNIYSQGYEGTSNNNLKWLAVTNYPHGDFSSALDLGVGDPYTVGIDTGLDAQQPFPPTSCADISVYSTIVSPGWSTTTLCGTPPTIKQVLDKDAANPQPNRRYCFILAGNLGSTFDAGGGHIQLFTGVSGLTTRFLWDQAAFRQEVANWIASNPNTFLTSNSATQTSSSISSSTSTTTSTTSTTTSTTSTTTSTTTSATSSSSSTVNTGGNRAFLRIRALDTNSEWVMTSYNAQQVLSMISDAYGGRSGFTLDRYINDAQNPNALVPVCGSCAPMTVSQFLAASGQACGGCIITPRISLNDYDAGTMSSASSNLLSLGFQYVSLDDWGGFWKTHTSSVQQQVLQGLLNQGWKGFGLNECGDYSSSFGLASWAMICFSGKQGYTPIVAQLNGVKSESNIQYVIGQIDFPNQATAFYVQPYDTVANSITTITMNQNQYGYSYLYLGVQGQWDTNTMTTSSSGPYQGKTIFQVEKSLMPSTPTTTMTTTSSTSTTSTPSSTTSTSSTTFTSSTSASSTSGVPFVGLSVSPSFGTVGRGGAISTSLLVSVGGTGQEATLSAANLPPGISVSFSPPQGGSSFTSIMQVQVSPSVSSGTYYITIRASSGGLTSTASYALSLSASHSHETLLVTALPPDGGTTSPSPNSYEFAPNATLLAIAYPATGFAFDHWALDGNSLGNSPLIIVNVGRNNSVLAAIFSPQNVSTQPAADVTFQARGVSAPAILVDGKSYSLPAAFSWPTGSRHNISASSISNSEVRGQFQGWTGSVQSSSETLSLAASPGMYIVANYQALLLTKLLFVDSRGNQLYPQNVTLLGPSGTLTVLGTSQLWLVSWGHYLIQSVSLSGITVAPSVAAGNIIVTASPGTYTVPLPVHGVQVRITDIFGEPLMGAAVSITTGDGRSITSHSDGDGVAHFPQFPQGPFTAHVDYLGLSYDVVQNSGGDTLNVTVALSFPLAALLVLMASGGAFALFRKLRNRMKEQDFSSFLRSFV